MAKAKLVLASTNQNKIVELKSLLSGFDVELISQGDAGVNEAEETGITFVENAIIKARHASRLTGLPAIADDSGLSVDVLHGAPGIYSSRYAGAHASADENNQRLLDVLKDVPDEKRSACFHCVLVLMLTHNDPTPLICDGIWQGTILNEPRGTEGFGYDPLFYIPSLQKTAAELSRDIKNKISHRGLALQLLLARLPEKLNEYERTLS